MTAGLLVCQGRGCGRSGARQRMWLVPGANGQRRVLCDRCWRAWLDQEERLAGAALGPGEGER